MSYTLRVVSSWDQILEDLRPGTELHRSAAALFNPNRPVFLVQSEMVKRWLQLRLADAGWVFVPDWVYPGGLFRDILTQVLGVGLEELLPSAELPFFALDPDVLGDGDRCTYTRALETAQLLERYAENFPELLDLLNEGGLGPETGTVGALWTKCRSRGRYPQAWHLWRLARDRVPPRKLSREWHIVVLGSAFLSVSELRFLARFSRHATVRHYLLATHPGGEETQHHLALRLLSEEGIVPESPADPRPSHVEVRVTSCWGPRREIETVAEDILDLLDGDPSLSLPDIGVLAMDWAPYRPYLDLVFSSLDEEASQTDRIPTTLLDSPALPYQLQSEDPVWEAFFHLVRLWLEAMRAACAVDTGGEGPSQATSATWTRSFLKRYLSHPWVVRALDLGDDFDWDGWCGYTRFHWGWDPAEVQALSPRIETHSSLTEAWGRFVAALGPEPQLPVPNWNQVHVFARVMAHLQDLRDWLRSPETPTWGRWLERLGDLVRSFFDRPWGDETVRGCAEYLLQRLSLTDGGGGEAYRELTCTVHDVSAFVEQHLRREGYRPQLLVNGLSFGSFHRLRSIPFDTVILLGMDERFPREESVSPEDLLRTRYAQLPDHLQRRVAILSTSRLDTQLFFDALALTRRRVWIYYQGRELTQDLERPPSPLVQRLLQEQGLEVRPTELYPFNGHASEDTATRFGRYAQIGAILAKGQHVPEVWAPPPIKTVETSRLSFHARLRTGRRPLREYLSQHMGFKAVWADDSDPDTERWELSEADYLRVLLDRIVYQGRVLSEDEGWAAMSEEFQRQLDAGGLGRHKDKSRLPDPGMASAWDLFHDRLLPLLSSEGFGTLKRIATADSEDSYYVYCRGSDVLLIDLTHKEFDPDAVGEEYSQFLIALELSLVARRIAPTLTGVALVKRPKATEPLSKKRPVLIAEAELLVERLAAWALARPCLLPLHANKALKAVRTGNAQTLYKQFLEEFELKDVPPGRDFAKREFRDCLGFLFQDRSLPDLSEWFAAQCSELADLLKLANLPPLGERP